MYNYALKMLLSSSYSKLIGLHTSDSKIGNKLGTNDSKIITLSGGGIDSFVATKLYLKYLEDDILEDEDYDNNTDTVNSNLYFLTFNYGQAVFETELKMTGIQSATLPGSKVIEFNDNIYKEIPILKEKFTDPIKEINEPHDYAPYIPSRNLRFLSGASAFAEQNNFKDVTIILGAVGQGHFDNSKNFIQAMCDSLNAGSKGTVFRIYAPFANLTKSVVVQAAEELGLTWRLPALTTSCFVSNDVKTKRKTKRKSVYQDENDSKPIEHCGVCKSCMSLKDAFTFAQIINPYDFCNNPEGKTWVVPRETEENISDVNNEELPKKGYPPTETNGSIKKPKQKSTKNYIEEDESEL